MRSNGAEGGLSSHADQITMQAREAHRENLLPDDGDVDEPALVPGAATAKIRGAAQ